MGIGLWHPQHLCRALRLLRRTVVMLSVLKDYRFRQFLKGVHNDRCQYDWSKIIEGHKLHFHGFAIYWKIQLSLFAQDFVTRPQKLSGPWLLFVFGGKNDFSTSLWCWKSFDCQWLCNSHLVFLKLQFRQISKVCQSGYKMLRVW